MGMQKHPRKPSGRQTPQRPPVTSPQEDIYGFFAALFALIAPGRFERLAEYRNSKRGRPPELSLPNVLAALLFQLLGRRLCDSAIAERRSVLPWALWEHWLREALRSTAHRRQHPEAFYRGWRLVAIDGTQFSVSNTPQTSKELIKASSRRAKAAFAKITACVLLEVGLHNPLAAAIGHSGQSEWQLSAQLLAQLAKGGLLTVDPL